MLPLIFFVDYLIPTNYFISSNFLLILYLKEKHQYNEIQVYFLSERFFILSLLA